MCEVSRNFQVAFKELSGQSTREMVSSHSAHASRELRLEVVKANWS